MFNSMHYKVRIFTWCIRPFFFAPQPSQIVGSSRPYCRQTCHFISFHKKNTNSTKRTPKWVSTERARHASISMLMLCLLTQELTTMFFEQLTVLNIELSWINISCPIVRLSGRFHIKSNCWFERMNQRMKTEVCMAAWKPATCSQQLLCVEYPHNTNWTQPFVCTYGFQGGSSKPSSVVTIKQVLPEVIQLLHLIMLCS